MALRLTFPAPPHRQTPRTYELAALSDEERRRWLAALALCLDADPAHAAPPTPGSARNLGAVAMEGLLEKRGKWNTAWKTRHFVLTDDGQLRYFRPGTSAAAAPPLGAIPLGTATVRAGGSDCGRDVIEIWVPGRTFVLGAPSRRERDEWLDALLDASGP